MSLRATRQETEPASVPSLRIMPRLEPGAHGNRGSRRTAAGVGRPAGLIALLAAVGIAVAALLLTGSHHPAGRPITATARGRLGGFSPRFAATGEVLSQTGARQAVAGLGAASRSLAEATSAEVAASNQATAAARAAPSPHYLSSSDLISLADGTSGYQPAAYLVRDYQSVAARYQIPWRVLAGIEYIKGDYVNATAGDSAAFERALSAQVQASGRPAPNARVLAQATAAAAQPSFGLTLDAKRLAADGATQSPARGITTFMSGTGVSTQSVLTLAQAIDSSVSSSAAPAVKVATMLNEAQLLNGLPYIWGGGHTEPAWVVSAGYDCSGFVSEILHSAGYLSSPDTTQTLPGSAGILSGPGKYVTIYDRTIATLKVWVKKKKMITKREMVNPATAGVHVTRGRRANSLTAVQITVPKTVGEWKTIHLTKLVRSQDTSNNDEHVIIDIDGQWWESGGSSADGGAAMVHPMLNPSSAYLKSFNQILHPQGL